MPAPEQQALSWHGAYTGSVPESYDRHLGPVLFEPYARDLVSRLQVREGLRVLELACGTGILTRRLREALPATATLVATDLNEAMLTHARRALHGAEVEWRQADAGALELEDESFDVVACQFGFMFLPDKPRAFAEARRVLRPGGRLLASVWRGVDENSPAQAVGRAVAALWPDDSPSFLTTPYGYFDHDRLRADLRAGGFEQVELEDVRLRNTAPSARDVARGFTRGTPLAHELADREAAPEPVEDAAAAIIGGEGPVEVELSAVVISAAR